tara:strand:- start:65 stop:472 length:408 start_codon:yes stop_codon:yes gene_type:complete
MSDEHPPEYYRGEFTKIIKVVGIVLIVGTLLSFGVDYIFAEDLSFLEAMAIGLGVACIKATAVILYFMHLKWDISYKTISITMTCTVIFFIGMMGLTVGSEIDYVKPGNKDTTWEHGEHVKKSRETPQTEQPIAE